MYVCLIHCMCTFVYHTYTYTYWYTRSRGMACLHLQTGRKSKDHSCLAAPSGTHLRMFLIYHYLSMRCVFVCVCVCACVRVCGVAIVCHANLHGLQVQSCLASLCGTCVDACVHVAGGRYACTRCRCPLIERSVGTSSIFLVSECAGLENADFRASDSGSAVNNIVLPYYSLPTPNHWPENLRS